MKKPLILASLFAASAIAVSLFVSAEESSSDVVVAETAVIENAASFEETTPAESVNVTSTEGAEEVAPAEGIIPAAIDESFQNMDVNHDGLISITEAENNDVLIDAFSELDLDKTADLTKEEYSKFVALTQF